MNTEITDQHVRRPLLLVLGVSLLTGVLMSALGDTMTTRAMCYWIMMLGTSYASFVWFCRDSDAHSYARSPWRNVLFIFIGLLFVPYYLVRTRTHGRRMVSLFKLLGFCVLYFIAALAGALLGALTRI